MFKRSVLNQITQCADGSIHLRFLKQVVDDDGAVIASVPHRAVVHPKQDPEKVMAFNCERLELKHAPVDKADRDWFEQSVKARKK